MKLQDIDFRSGDTVRVSQRIKEGDKTRVQAFEGIVIARKHGREQGATFTVRKASQGIGIERTYPLYSPLIEKLEVVKRASRARRAKLYFIREKAARETRKKLRQTRVEIKREEKAEEVKTEEVSAQEVEKTENKEENKKSE